MELVCILIIIGILYARKEMKKAHEKFILAILQDAPEDWGEE